MSKIVIKDLKKHLTKLVEPGSGLIGSGHGKPEKISRDVAALLDTIIAAVEKGDPEVLKSYFYSNLPDGLSDHVRISQVLAFWEMITDKTDELMLKAESKIKDVVIVRQILSIGLRAWMDRIQKKSRDADKRYSDLFHALPLGVFIFDINSRIDAINEAAVKLLGYDSADELIGKSVIELYLNPDDHDGLLSIIAHRGYVSNSIIDWKSKDGEPILVELDASPVRDENNVIRGIQGIARDITMQLKSQIQQQEALAEVTSSSIDSDKILEMINFYRTAPQSLILQGIAHNINSPLGSLRGRAELTQFQIRKKLGEFDELLSKKELAELKQFMHKILKNSQDLVDQVDKISAIVQSFAEKVANEMVYEDMSIDLNELIRNELNYFEASLYFKHKYMKNVDYDSDLPVIKGRYLDFSQTVHNVIIQSMKATIQVDERKISIKTSHNENHVFIEFTDNRPTMDGAEIENLLKTDFDITESTTPYEAGFSKYNIEFRSIRKLLERYQAELKIESDRLTVIRIAIPRNL